MKNIKSCQQYLLFYHSLNKLSIHLLYFLNQPIIFFTMSIHHDYIVKFVIFLAFYLFIIFLKYTNYIIVTLFCKHFVEKLVKP